MQTNDPVARALALFDRYAEMPHAALSVALAELQREDADACIELLRMLAADEQTHSFASPLQWFSSHGGAAAGDEHSVDRIWPDGTRLGPWCVDGIIGLGGMGVVYAAHRADGLYEREVALKTIRTEIMSPALQQAFAKERNHLAKLDHPSIVALHDAGVADGGQPWLAMQRIHGDAIDRWCDAHSADLRTRVRLLIETCDAIAYAHAHGVLHQDIKPSNVLVTDDGHVKLLDFGLSAIVAPQGDRGFTRIGVSSAYAAPEVFEGAPPSVAIDVYALGVVLYRLLCEGWPRTPRALTALPDARDDTTHSPSLLAIKAAPAATLARGVRSAQALSNALKGDLDAIALRCISFDPVARYASVADLQIDLQAWLDRRPVAASEGGWFYRTSRFVRRNALAFTATIVLLLASAGGGLVALRQQERVKLEAESSEILSDLFEKSLGAATLSTLGAAPLSSQTLLEDVERQLRATAGNDRPQLLARGLSALARSYLVRADYKSVERLLSESKKLGDGDPLQIARDNAVLAQMLNERGDATGAERLVKEGLRLIPKRNGLDGEVTRIDLAFQHAKSRLTQGDLEGASAMLDDAVVSAEKMGKDARPTLVVLLRLRSLVNASMGRFEKEREDIQAALAMIDGQDMATRNSVQIVIAINLARKGKIEEAHRLTSEILVRTEKEYGPAHVETGLAWLAAAKTWYGVRDVRRTEIALDQSESILTAQLGPNARTIVDVMTLRAALSNSQGDLDDAMKYMRRAVEISEKSYGTHSNATFLKKESLAMLINKMASKQSGALKATYYREAEAILSDIIRNGESRGLRVGYARTERVAPLLFLNRIEEAEKEAQIGLDESFSKDGDNGEEYRNASINMMQVRIAQGRFDEAIAVLGPRERHLSSIDADPEGHYQLQELILDIEIARGDPERIRTQYIKLRKIAERYGFMDEINAKNVPGVGSADRR
ncbi:MAG: serine/threonine protein kinase [Xanthomonadales bacterium]|nr:serine/threonine protein kinase [Xanthomonadales bacterium]